MARSLIVIFAGLQMLAVGCFAQTDQPAKMDQKTYTFDDATIVSVDRPLFASGYYISWTKIVASVPNNNPIDLYMIYFGEEQAFPLVGAKCFITVDERHSEIFVAEGNMGEIQYSLFPTLMECDGKTYRY